MEQLPELVLLCRKINGIDQKFSLVSQYLPQEHFSLHGLFYA